MTKLIIPPIKCQGIKTKLVPFIMEHAACPENGLWIEPFMGSGVVAFNLAPRRALLADKNEYIIAFYQGIQNGTITTSVVREFLEYHGSLLQQYGEAYYREMRDAFNENGDPLYSVTRKGRLVAEQLKCDILPSILDQSLTCALRYLDFRRRGVTVTCESERLQDQTFDVTVTLREQKKIILRTTINTDSEYHAQKMKETFHERPEVVYRGILALLTGTVGFLYDDKRE